MVRGRQIIKMSLPFILDKNNPDLFKDEDNLTPLERLISARQNFDLNSRLNQSQRFNHNDRMNKDKEDHFMGKPFNKNGKWFIKKTFQVTRNKEIFKNA